MRQFYILIEKGVAMPHLLSWTHVMSILPIDNVYKANYFMKIAEEQNLSYRKLREKIKNMNQYVIILRIKSKREHLKLLLLIS